MKVGDYPGHLPHGRDPPEDWHLLPEVPHGRDSVNLDLEAEDRLAKRRLHHRPDAAGDLLRARRQGHQLERHARRCSARTASSAAGSTCTTSRRASPRSTGSTRRFAGMRLVIGDALHSLGDLGSGALRLDANGFLGVEKSAEDSPAWSEGHPLSEAANQLIASMVRKVGGFTFQELNLTIDDIKSTAERGADLSYDFVNRPAYHHALATGDTEFLRLTLNLALRVPACDPASLVHALQNHDELTYELVHFATLHARRHLHLPRRASSPVTSSPNRARQSSSIDLTGEAAPYNATFTTERHRVHDRDDHRRRARLSADLDALTRRAGREDQAGPPAAGHVQRAAAGRLRPVRLGSRAGCSRWTGGRSADLLADGDTRWIHRAAYDLMDYRPHAHESLSKMPRGISLYGSLPEQLRGQLVVRSPARARSWRSASATASPPASSSTCRRCPTRPCW